MSLLAPLLALSAMGITNAPLAELAKTP